LFTRPTNAFFFSQANLEVGGEKRIFKKSRESCLEEIQPYKDYLYLRKNMAETVPEADIDSVIERLLEGKISYNSSSWF
jgi:hypothetical protein